MATATNAASTPNSQERTRSTLGLSVRELIVDFLGILLPGFAFAMALVPSIVLPGYILIWVLAGNEPDAINPETLPAKFIHRNPLVTDDLRNIFDLFRFEFLITVGALSYIMGHLFFRQDPKIPDQIGYFRLPLTDKEDGPVRVFTPKEVIDIENKKTREERERRQKERQKMKGENDKGETEEMETNSGQSDKEEYGHKSKAFPLRFFIHVWEAMSLSRLSKKLKIAWAKKQKDKHHAEAYSEESVEFPYPYLNAYLNERGMHYLADHINWHKKPSGDISEISEEETRKRNKLRTKHFINVLKIRLEFEFPEKFGRVARNEAHIRLVSSAWYASCAVILLSIVGLFLGVTANVVSDVLLVVKTNWWPIPHPAAAIVPASTLIGSVMIKDRIESSIHYMRIREIVFVLETASWAAKEIPKILEDLPDLEPPKDKRGKARG